MKNSFASLRLCGKDLPVEDPDFNPDLEGDMLAEEMSGKPTRFKTTAAAIAALEKRVAYLTQLAERAVHPENILADLRQAKADLDSYRRQHEARN